MPEPPESDSPAKHKQRIKPRIACMLFAILLLGGWLRFTALTWSLPDSLHPIATYHPDELVDLRATSQVDIAHGKLDIGFYNYGTLYFYLADLAQTIGHGYGLTPTVNLTPEEAASLSPIDKAQRVVMETRGMFLAGRLVSALLGVLTIPVLFFVGRNLYSEEIGLVSAALMAIAPLAAVHSHFYTVDSTATFFACLALLPASALLKVPTLRLAALAGVATGLTAASKYSAVLVAVAPIAAILISGSIRQKESWKLLGVLASAAIVAFLIACPGPLINWEAFWNGLPGYAGSGVRYELLEHPRQGHGLLFVNTGPGWWYHLVISLRYGLGIPMLALCGFGIVSASFARTAADRMLLIFVLVFYGVTGLSAVRFARYMLPMYPALCLLAARFVLAPERSSAVLRRAAYVTGALLMLLTLGYTGSLVRIMASTDPRDSAAQYLTRIAVPGTSVAFAKTPWYFSPPLSPWFGEMAAPSRRKCIESTRYRFVLPTDGIEFDKGVLDTVPDFVATSNIENMHEARLSTPGEKQFFQEIRARYQPMVFHPSGLFDMAASGSLVPDDLLYILPQVTVWKRNSR